MGSRLPKPASGFAVFMTEQTSDWTNVNESGFLWQLKLMRFLASRAPTFVVDALLWLIALFFALNIKRSTTAASAHYLGRALDRKPSLMDRQRHALVFSHVLLDRVRLLSEGAERISIESRGQELVSDLVSQGRGAVLLGAHFGSFEALRAFDRKLPGLFVRYLMYPEHAQKSTALLHELNPALEERVISLANGPMAMIKVFETLSTGGFVAILGDRFPNKTAQSQVSVTFFGGQINVPTSPYLAAMAAKVPLITSFATWEGKGRYAACFSQLYDGTPVPRAQRAQHAQKMAQKYASGLEDMCRRNPYNWFNFYDVWNA